jgi:AcrR family transcriptional regulator
VPRFTREQLARRALGIIDAYGADGLTMRRLAGELGIGTMTLYRYFPSKNDLVDAAIDAAAAEIVLPAAARRNHRAAGARPDPGTPSGKSRPAEPEIASAEPEVASWRDDLAELARALFLAGLKHPSLARERFDRPLQSPGAMRMTDRAIGLLLEAGLAAQDAVAAFKALLIHSLGAAAVAASESRPEVRRNASARHASLPDEVPSMAAVADELTAALGGDQAFEFGLMAMLDGIEARVAR